MADEAKTVEEQDEALEPQEEINPEEESTEEKTEETVESVEPEEPEEGLEGVDEYENEEDYFESLGVGKQTGEQVAEEIKKLREDNASLRQYRAETGFEKPQPQTAQSTEEHRFIKESGLASKHVGTLRFNDDEAGQRSKQSHSIMAQLVDSAVDPVIKQVEQAMQTFRGGFAEIAKHLIKESYNGFSRKDLVKLEDIQDQMLNDFNFDAGKYAKRYLFESKPDLLSELTRKAEKKGEERGQQKRLKRFSSSRRGKPSPRSVGWETYFTQGKPNDKYHSLPNSKEKLKVAEAYEKAALAAER